MEKEVLVIVDLKEGKLEKFMVRIMMQWIT